MENLGFTGDAYLNEWPNTLNKLFDEFPECRIVVPGHGKYGGVNLIKHTLELF